MLSHDELHSALKSIPTQAFQGVCYQAVTRRMLLGDPPHPEVRPLYDQGAAIKGARYTPIGSMKALYLSEDPETAITEVHQIYAELRRNGFMGVIPATVIFSVEIMLDAFLDLTDTNIQGALNANISELCDPTWLSVQDEGGAPLTQQFAQIAFDTGRIQAMRYPSAQLEGHACWVVFTERVFAPNYVRVNDPDGYLQGNISR